MTMGQSEEKNDTVDGGGGGSTSIQKEMSRSRIIRELMMMKGP